ncbi:PREDICTED: pigment-dispersing hormone peptides-like [Trachymyrmex septentrionalis]|uniref:pigment-dispersing hormone peptides-like n=1 Tax=Trachymyrmex septentrionalis TaxID=34720 RepID=UPI00084F1929|nr:PREDICTED: pigment-dispersing hormone peptides-like [Trachymyrmex septentrionalis]
MGSRYKRNRASSDSRRIRVVSTSNSIRCHFNLYCKSPLPTTPKTSKSMANYVRFAVIVAIIIGIVRGEESSELEDIDRNILKLNLPYGRRLDNELELVRLMLVAPRLCHPKRNSELINSLLGLPKNMHNAGKRKLSTKEYIRKRNI